MSPRRFLLRRAVPLACAAAALAPAAAWAQAAATGPNPPSVHLGMAGVVYMKTKAPLFAYAGPDEHTAVLDELTGETVVPVTGCGGGWCRVVMSRSQPSFIRQELLDPVTPRH